jgi:phage terminase small subunit
MTGRRKKPLQDLPIDYRKFVLEYVRTGSPIQAARAAGKTECSNETASQFAYMTLRRPEVKLEIERASELITQKIEWQIEDSMRELVAVAMHDFTDVYEDVKTGKLVDVEQIPAQVRRCIKRIEMGTLLDIKTKKETPYIKKIEFYDRMAAIEMLNKHKGFYKEDNEQKVDALSLLLESIQREGSRVQPKE